MLFVCYPKCTTCQKAQKWLDEHGVRYEIRNIKEENPTEAELRLWHARSGLPLRRFFNTSGLQYRALNLKERLPEMREDEQFALLATDGMLVKRPILIAEDFVLVGFREKEYAEKLRCISCFTAEDCGSPRSPVIGRSCSGRATRSGCAARSGCA